MKSTLRVMLFVILALALTSAAWATNVTFQVNMSYQQTLGNFTPPSSQVVVRGSFNGWGGDANMLTDQGGGIYAGTWEIPDASIEYKFVIINPPPVCPNGGWEWCDNRYVVLGGGDQIIPEVWFACTPPPAGYTDVEVLFCCDMTVQILTGAFNPATDMIVVRGNHANIGNWGGTTQLLPQVGNPNVYELWVQFTQVPINQAIEFKYVFINGSGDHWEGDPNRSFTPTSTGDDFLPPPAGNGYFEIYPGCPYFSNIAPGQITTHAMDITFQCNISSIWQRLIAEGPFTVNGQFIDNIGSFQVAGYLNSWPWANFTPEYFLHNDGLNGDAVAGDNVWSVTVVYPAGSPLELIYKYGCIELDAEAGFAENHSVVLNDALSNIVLPVDCFGSQGTFYTAYPCTDIPLAVELASFTATEGDNSVTLNWSTASETDNASFEIVRNGSLVGSIPAAGSAHNYQWVDSRVSNGTLYSYTLVSVDVNGNREELRTVNATPSMNAGIISEYALRGNYPNPFNPTTDIVFDLKETGNVSLKVYNMLGQQVAELVNGSMEAGRHTLRFDATNLPSGMYIYKMEANGFSALNKMMLMK